MIILVINHFLFYLFNDFHKHTLFSDEVRYIWTQMSAMPLICYDFIFPIFNVLTYEMGDIDNYLIGLLLDLK